MSKWLAIVVAFIAVAVIETVSDVIRGVLTLIAVGVALAVVWGLNWWLGAPWYLMFVAVPLAVAAVWPLARLMNRLD
jgi:predicted RND superfamily exporter protein